jgi:hypothetical protein
MTLRGHYRRRLRYSCSNVELRFPFYETTAYRELKANVGEVFSWFG